MTCYWSKGTKYRGTGGLYSPSLSDTLKRKGSSILCGSQSLRNKKRSSGSQKQKYISTCSQGLPLLANSCDEGNSSLDTASDELSTKLGELDLEAVGVVSDDKLLDLLEIAMSSDNAETVKRSRELMDSGVDPIALMSQLAGLIMDIIAGTYELTNLQNHDTPLGKRSREYIKLYPYYND
ncbi:hypothetical protein B296_00013327 [Ensete ventricosum]|uniref:DNA polymerase III gamma subunit domain-containing protein n=1 Tax=Ensete ventricosum TaxID=4639 RepID=A0A427ARF2_ENSVE|nr:hypothetical protein B296_00013327 [Ensete ventricosum]